MKYSTCTRALLVASCSSVLGIALLLLAMVGAISGEAFAPAIAALMAGAGVLAWTGAQLWSSTRGETIAFRVLYHAPEPPDGSAVTRALEALARSAGHVSVIWRFHPPVAAARADSALTGESSTGGAVHRQDGQAPTANYADVSLYIVARAEAQRGLEGMLPGLLPSLWAERCMAPAPLKPPAPSWGVRVWRWGMASMGNGELVDPLACGMHLEELAAALALPMGSAEAGKPSEIGAVEVRLKVWPHGRSAIVTAQCSLAHLSRTASVPARSSDTSPRSPASLLSSLKPLLGGWIWQWPRAHSGSGSGYARGRSKAGSPERGKGAAGPVTMGHQGAVMAALVANYPLWEDWPGARPPASRSGHETDQLSPSADNDISRGETAGVSCEARNSVLRFPSTTGSCSSLDSVLAGEVPPSPSYGLPPVDSQILVLGSASFDGRPVGIPALRKPQPATTSSSSAVSSSPPKLSLISQQNKGMSLHPLLAEHLLVMGGSDAWRRDVAGSVVSQALEMGMTVVAVDGGAPPDEPPSSARKRARVASGDMKARGVGSAPAGADPLSPVMLGLRETGDPAFSEKRIAQIDMDNPAGSVHPNMLYVPAPSWLPPAQGEAVATALALQVGLLAQLRFLRGVNVTGIDAGMMSVDLAQMTDDGPGMAILEAWLTVLLLRHHRARLLFAVNGIPLSSGFEGASREVSVSGVASSNLGGKDKRHKALYGLPACPDLPALMVVLEQSEALLELLKRELTAWNDPEWRDLLRDAAGGAGECAVQAARAALVRAKLVEGMDLSDMFLYGAALRGQFKRVLGHSAMMRMLTRPHISLAELLDVRATRMLRVSLSGAYHTTAPPYGDDDVSRKHYGLYLLWAMWAMSQQRKTLQVLSLARSEHEKGCVGCPGGPDPVLLMLHGAGAWFGSGSPLSDASTLAEFGRPESGVAVAATASGLRHMRGYRAGACEAFGNLVIGPPPVADPDAPDVTLHLVDQEARLMGDGMQKVARRLVDASALPSDLSQEPEAVEPPGDVTPGSERLVKVLRRIDEGTALVMTGMPGKRLSVCTAHVGSWVAAGIRNSWSSTSSMNGFGHGSVSHSTHANAGRVGRCYGR